MKRTIIFLSLTLLCVLSYSQTLYDGLKTSIYDISGTARYSSMAGAFGALGGDASSIKDNPAGLGIFRKSEISFSTDFLNQKTESAWNETHSNNSRTGSVFNNFSYIMALPTWRNESGTKGLLSSNFSFTYNKLKNFDRKTDINSKSVNSSMTDYFGYFTGDLPNSSLEWDNYPQNGISSPFDNVDLPWMSVMAHYGRLIRPYNNGWESLLSNGEKVTPSYVLNENGKINEYSVGWSGNFSNRLYLGATLNLQSIDYSAHSIYNEEFGNNGGMTLVNDIFTTGNGVNLNVGAIMVPADFMRIGIALHSPLIYKLTTTNYSTLSFNTTVDGSLESPSNNKDYEFKTPMVLNLSTAFILNSKGLFSIEYVLTNFSGAKMMDQNGNTDEYKYDNVDIKNMLNNSGTIKVGGEYKLTDNLALRGGYAYTGSITKPDATKWMAETTVRTDPEFFLHNSTSYLTAGFGYRTSGWFIDFALVHIMQNESYYAFNSKGMDQAFATNPAEVKTTDDKLVLSLGLKF